MIRILDMDFNLLGEIDDFESLVLIRRYNSYGDFEINISKGKRNTNMLKRGNIIFLDPYRAGIIEYVGSKLDVDSETLTVKGYTLEHILAQRITLPPSGQEQWKMKGKAESVVKALVNYNLGPGANRPERIITEVAIAKDQARGNTVDWGSRFKNLDEEVAEICAKGGVGIQCYLDLKGGKIALDVTVNRDLTPTQAVHPPVIFCVDFDNVTELQLVDSSLDYKNMAVVAGQGEGIEREVIELGNDFTGLGRRELFVDARDINQGEIEALQVRGEEKLAELPLILNLEGQINPHHSLKYGADFLLGDRVAIKYGGYALNTNIVEITESWENPGEYTVSCIFGDKIPDLVDKIKKIVRS